MSDVPRPGNAGEHRLRSFRSRWSVQSGVSVTRFAFAFVLMAVVLRHYNFASRDVGNRPFTR